MTYNITNYEPCRETIVLAAERGHTTEDRLKSLQLACVVNSVPIVVGLVFYAEEHGLSPLVIAKIANLCTFYKITNIEGSKFSRDDFKCF